MQVEKDVQIYPNIARPMELVITIDIITFFVLRDIKWMLPLGIKRGVAKLGVADGGSRGLCVVIK